MATIDTIRDYFANILQRSGSEVTDAEINSYVSAVDSGALTLAQVRSALINSPEGQDVQDVVRLYQTVFGRVPDKEGLNDQVDALRGPATESDLANSFANSPEFISRFGGNTVNQAFINAVYQQVLGRTPSAGEVQFYLDSGFSAGRIALAFSESPEFQSAVSVAVETFLDNAGQGTADYTGPLGGTVNEGNTFTLTDELDQFTGTAGDDVFQGTAASIGAFDSINGADGNDTLNIIGDLADSVFTGVSIASVETVNVTGNETEIDADLFGDEAEAIWQINTAADITGLASDQTAGFRNIATTTTQNVTLGFTGDVANIALDDDGALQFVIADVDTGASDVDLKTVNISGSTDGLLELGSTLPDTVETINLALDTDSDISVQSASALSNVVTIDASSSTGDLTIGYANVTSSELEALTLGGGDDGVSIDTANLIADAVAIDLGAGNDDLVVTLDATGDTDATITLGEGDDVVSVSGANVNVNDEADGFDGSVTITDFEGASDTLLIDGFNGYTAQNLVNNAVADAESLYEAVEAVAAVVTGGGTNVTDFAQFTFEGNTYVYGDSSGDAALDGDTLIALTGVVDLNNDNTAEIV